MNTRGIVNCVALNVRFGCGLSPAAMRCARKMSTLYRAATTARGFAIKRSVAVCRESGGSLVEPCEVGVELASVAGGAKSFEFGVCPNPQIHVASKRANAL